MVSDFTTVETKNHRPILLLELCKGISGEERIVKEKKRTEEEKGCVAAGRWPRREKSK